MLKSIVDDQYTAARAYFLCVIGMLIFEALLRVPEYWLVIRHKDKAFVKPSSTHSIIRSSIHKLFTLPSPIPFVTTHTFPIVLRCAVFTGLNVLWGITRIRFTTDFKLFGWLCISNGGLALLFAARSNLLSSLLRVPTTTIAYYHRWCGRATVIHATIHTVLNIQQYLKTDQLATVFGALRIQVGIMAWIALALMFLTSLNFVRRRVFEVFYYTHFLFIVFVVGACIHAHNGPEFLLPGVGLWAVDRAIRFYYNFRSLEVRSVRYLEGDVTKFTIEGVEVRRPGQMVWMQIPMVSRLNWHPFTVAAAPEDGKAVVAIRGLGGYTKKIQRLAEGDGMGITLVGSGDDEGMSSSSPIKVRIDGPYGVSGVKWGLHSVTVLVAGGIGITPGISIASHIIQRAAQAGSPAQQHNGEGYGDATNGSQWHIHLLWALKDRAHISWFATELRALLRTANNHPNLTFSITIHTTGRSVPAPMTPVSSVGSENSGMLPGAKDSYSDLGMIQQGRPDIMAWFQDVKARRPGLDAVVNACGPRPLITEARRSCASVSGRDGLFHFEQEVFEL
ncbi:ferric reductase like transmembrane component-domain-containing protein [Rhexocercosporidium sp. MPI-PUGE-AT-0058]|nr:ferric reductase like transmembrane component-domain-containing protein [Rhexocercosporidium sp. MPI-PUGE-AT-0058]